MGIFSLYVSVGVITNGPGPAGSGRFITQKNGGRARAGPPTMGFIGSVRYSNSTRRIPQMPSVTPKEAWSRKR